LHLSSSGAVIEFVSPEPRGRSRQARDLWERAVKREINLVRVWYFLIVIVVALAALPVFFTPTAAQTADSPSAAASAKPKDEPTSGDSKPAKDAGFGA
jgi:cytochrome c-type biogenesis protein CcmH/NrfG